MYCATAKTKRQREKAKRITQPDAGREAEGSEQQANSEPGFVLAKKKSQHTVRHSRGHSQQFVAGGSWQVADKLLPQPRGELAYRTLVNR